MAQQNTSGNTIRTIDITPTPNGLRQMGRLFTEQCTQSNENLRQVDELKALIDAEGLETGVNHQSLSHAQQRLITKALDLFYAQEEKRVWDMQEGIAEVNRCLPSEVR